MSRTNTSLTLLIAAAMLAGCGEGAPSSTGVPPVTESAAPAQAAGKPSEDEIKAVIQRRLESLATGVGSAHKSVVVTFDGITFGDPRPLNEQDRIDGLRGDRAYPVRAKYSELRTWGNGETETVNTHYAYDFYRDEFGEWNYNAKGPVQ